MLRVAQAISILPDPSLAASTMRADPGSPSPPPPAQEEGEEDEDDDDEEDEDGEEVYTCDFKCDYRGNYEEVLRHEAFCPLRP